MAMVAVLPGDRIHYLRTAQMLLPIVSARHKLLAHRQPL